MSLFGNLLTTYEMIQGASGQTPHSAEKDGDVDAAKKALIPYGHTTLPVSLLVLVGMNGCIRGVAKIKRTIIIPCTEESMGRTIKPVPHPLFDQLQYVDSERSPEKTSMYLQQLAKWKGDDAKLEAVFKCVSEHSISEAAAHYGVELTDKDDKAGVCFEVQIGLEDSDLSNDVDIRNRWIAYLQRSQHRLGKDVFGEDLYTPTTNFPKKVVSSDANAKLLSANDSTNFTFRGRSDRSSANGAELKRETFINCACGTSDRSSKSYKRFAKDVKERLIECMFGGAQFPMSILNAACHKVTKPMGYDNIRVWRRDFEIACSLWKKHYIDETRKQHRQEDVITMYLEPNRDDRDYLYGRLLALADNFEESVLRKQGVKDRPTNAIKLMSNFTAKPYTTWGTLWKQLTPYLKSANGGSWFCNEVDDVMALFKEGDFEDNKALSPMFLLGYSCQRRASKRKAQEISQKNNSNN